jgi:hypothetical protein
VNFLKKRALIPVFEDYNKIPYWNGEDLNGKTLLIFHHNKYGDCISSSRFIPWLKKYYDCTVKMAVKKPLMRLFASQPFCHSVYEILKDKEIEADYRIWAFDLQMDLTDKLREPWLKVPYGDPFEVRTVGYVYNSSLQVKNRNEEVFTNLRTLYPDVRFLSLQYENSDVPYSDFYELGEIVQRMKLILTVDTAISHLSPALGVETWVMSVNSFYSHRQDVWYDRIVLTDENQLPFVLKNFWLPTPRAAL